MLQHLRAYDGIELPVADGKVVGRAHVIDAPAAIVEGLFPVRGLVADVREERSVRALGCSDIDEAATGRQFPRGALHELEDRRATVRGPLDELRQLRRHLASLLTPCEDSLNKVVGGASVSLRRGFSVLRRGR